MVNCCVDSCPSDSKKHTRILNGVGFHRFPKGCREKIELWEAAINKPNWNATANSRICSKHFKEDCFYVSPDGAKKLRDNAIPSEHLLPIPKEHPPPTDSKSPEHDPDLKYEITDSPKIKKLKQRLIYVTELSERRRKHIKTLRQMNRRLVKRMASLKKVLNGLHNKYKKKFTNPSIQFVQI